MPGSTNTAVSQTSSDFFYSGPYAAERRAGRKRIRYLGGARRAGIEDVSALVFGEGGADRRLRQVVADEAFRHLHAVDNAVFFSAVSYFQELGAHWCNLPLTTMMISSPGEVYADRTLDYTTDTLPIRLSWFDHDREIFLAESSQFYLELRLLIERIDRVFCIYNSFRKERADFSHLAEFQHIEFEGKVGFAENIRIAEGLVRAIVQGVMARCPEALGYFLPEEDLTVLEDSIRPEGFERLTFKEALRLLRRDTGDGSYGAFSLRHFGAWEEVRLTEIVGRHVWLTEFPVLEIPFYHNVLKHDADGDAVAENADLILRGYREVVGSGARIADPALLAEKARVFNLPPQDYAPYLETRSFGHYAPTAGFGLGWQRLTHWLLKLPAIWEAVHIPRGHLMPVP